MTRSRACDPCATRKIKCERGNPCKRCHTLEISCTTSRAQSKPGPKGPWAEKRRLARLQENARQHSTTTTTTTTTTLIECQFEPFSATEEEQQQQLQGDSGSSNESSGSSSVAESPPPSTPQFAATLPISLIRQYLDLYHDRLYPIWPVVDRDEMSMRIQDPEDTEAYALCTALTAVVLSHFKYNSDEISSQASSIVDHACVAGESERARAAVRYHEQPSLELLLSSFFLHIFYANHGHVCKATVLIREAITFAQFLELDQAKHYIQRPKREAQLHLRIIWILSITERGHTTRFDLPRILNLDPDLPPLETQDVQPGLRAFTDLCLLFQTFGRAMDSDVALRTAEFFMDTDSRLQAMRQLQSKTQAQQADFLITQQWMRIIIWKMSIFHIKLSMDADQENLSLCFPERVAHTVLVYLNNLSRNIIEAHGIGIQMKLADVAISLADMLSCIPWVADRRQVMRIGPSDMVCHIAQFLASLRGNVNPRMNILFEKLQSRAWAHHSPRSIPYASLDALPPIPPLNISTPPTGNTLVYPVGRIKAVYDSDANVAENENNNDDNDNYAERTIQLTPEQF